MNFMLNSKSSSLLILMFITAMSSLSFAARDGNGGDAVVCRDKAGQIQNAELLDYYEGRVLRSIPLDLGASTVSVTDKVKIALSRLAKISPVRATLYAEQLTNFMNETQFLPGVQLVLIPDAEPTALPIGCNIEQLAIQRVPQFPGDKPFIISQDIWNKLDADNQAGLILHEIIYREAIAYGHYNSVNVRYFNSLISSPHFVDTLKTQKQIYDFMLLIHFAVTDFNGVRFGLLRGNEASYVAYVHTSRGTKTTEPVDVIFSKNGNFMKGPAAFPRKDSLILQGQKLTGVSEVTFQESGLVSHLILDGTYIDPQTKIELSGELSFYPNGQISSGFASRFRHPASNLVLAGHTKFDKNGVILESDVPDRTLSGRNYFLKLRKNNNFGTRVTLNEKGEVTSAHFGQIDEYASWISIGQSKIRIENGALDPHKTGLWPDFQFDQNGFLRSGFTATSDAIYQISIQGQSVYGAGDFKIRDDGGLEELCLVSTVELTVGNLKVEFKGGRVARDSMNKPRFCDSGKLTLFNSPNDVIKSGYLFKPTTLALASGGKRKISEGWPVEFNERGQVVNYSR